MTGNGYNYRQRLEPYCKAFFHTSSLSEEHLANSNSKIFRKFVMLAKNNNNNNPLSIMQNLGKSCNLASQNFKILFRRNMRNRLINAGGNIQ